MTAPAGGWAVCWWRALTGLVLALGAAQACMAAPGAALALTTATVVVDVAGVSAAPAEVSLPFQWDHRQRGAEGAARFDIPFDLDVLPADERYGLYVPRVGNAYEVWLNGVLLEQNGDLAHHGGADFAQVPQYIRMPPNLLGPRNLLRVKIRTDVGRRGGLSVLHIGPEAEVEALYDEAYHWRVTGSRLVVGFSLFVGLGALVLWFTQTDRSQAGRPRRDPLYLYAGLAELFWTVRIGDVLIVSPPLPWPLWGVVPVMALGAWVYCMTQFCIDAAGWRGRTMAEGFGRWVGLLAVCSGALAYLALGQGKPLALTLWYGTLLASFLVFGALFVARSLRHAQWPARLIALSILLNVAVGLRDFYVFRIDPSYPDNSLMRYSSVVFGLALGYFVVTRFRAASAQARDLLANLAARVTEKEKALQLSYAEVEQLAAEQARSSERTRILRDMHDGVGAHISSAIRQLQSGRADPAQVLHTLRDSLDQLKLSIDAIHLPAGDVGALLANLRYRLAPRFAASDIALSWEVDVLPVIPALDAQAMRQLQFMLFEAMSNVLQHAHATVLQIEAGVKEGAVRVRIVDNGRGFDVNAPWRKGLMGLRDRASAIGARLDLSSQPGRTVVEIQLS